jgi:drug/metabolite transporter (DMT)-like permease
MSPIVILAALAAVILWGASPVAAKVAVADFSPFSVAVLRTFLGGALAVPVALALKVRWPAQRRLQGLLLLSAFCGFVAFPMLFTFGVRLTSANHASMILASLPIFTGAIAMGWDRRRPTRIWIIGSLIALAGEVILIGGRTGGGAGQATIAGDALVFLSNGFASLGYVAGGRLQQAGYPSTGTTFWGAAAMALLLAPVVPVLWTQGAFAVASVAAWSAIAYLAVVVTILGYVLWYWALGRGGIARVGLIQFLQPLSGIVLAAVLLHETVSLSFLLASALVLLGVWLAMKGK